MDKTKQALYDLMAKSGMWKPETLKAYYKILDNAEIVEDTVHELTGLVDDLTSLCQKSGVTSPAELDNDVKIQADEMWLMVSKIGVDTGKDSAYGIKDNPYWEFDSGRIYLYDSAPALTKKVEPYTIDSDGTEIKLLIAASSIVFDDGTMLQEKLDNGDLVGPAGDTHVPKPTAADNGKFLRVVSGKATWQTIANAEGVSF